MAAYRYEVEKGLERRCSNNRGEALQTFDRTQDILSLRGIEAAFDKPERAAPDPNVAMIFVVDEDLGDARIAMFLMNRAGCLL